MLKETRKCHYKAISIRKRKIIMKCKYEEKKKIFNKKKLEKMKKTKKK